MTQDETLKSTATNDAQAAYAPATISARDLQLKEFPPVSWIVESLIPEGLTLLAGKPKLGKSWLALQLGYAVATGGEFLGRQAEPGAVLYAALEDNHRRLKSRLQKTRQTNDCWPEKLEFATEWPRLDARGLEALDSWLGRNPDAKLIIIDTLATVRPTGNANEKIYQADYAALRGLHGLANKLGIAIVVVHHVRKAEAEDPFDTVSGSTGLTGAADATLILSSTPKGKVLYGRGRDLEEIETAVAFDKETCLWSDLGCPSEAFGSTTRKAIRDAFKAGLETPKDITKHTGLDYDLCAKTLIRMAESGEACKLGRGRYALNLVTSP